MCKDAMRKVGERVAQYRLAHKISQQTFAERCGISIRYLSSIENGGANLTFTNLVKISDAIGIKPSELFRSVGY